MTRERIYIRPPGDWSTMTEEEQLEWVRALLAEAAAGFDDEPEPEGVARD